MMSRIWSVVNNANYSLVFGQNVTIIKNNETAFYSTTAPCVVRITDVLHLTPRSVPPPSPQEGDIYYDGNFHKLRVYDGTTWRNCY
ncbi:hypothetical protein J7J62_08710 [bacterium]|nr:hypothetical protein [bacterium]